MTSTNFRALPLHERQHYITNKPIAEVLKNCYHDVFKETLNREPSTALYHKIETCWNEKHRFYHNAKHLTNILCEIERRANPVGNGVNPCKEDYYRVLVLAAIFHDIVHDPLRSDNEERSAEYWMQVVGNIGWVANTVNRLILQTKWLASDQGEWDELTQLFFDLDCGILVTYDQDQRNLPQLIQYERDIYREYQHVSIDVYRQNRIEFLKAFGTKFCLGAACEKLIQWIEEWVPRVAVYAGSFNPFTVGHLDILQQAEKQFDKVIVAVGVNPEKSADAKSSHRDLVELLCHHEVVVFHGALTDELARQEALGQDVTLVRGLRNGYDLEYERKILYPSQSIKPDLKAVLLMCHHENEMVSSTLVRELQRLGKSADSLIATTEQIYQLQ